MKSDWGLSSLQESLLPKRPKYMTVSLINLIAFISYMSLVISTLFLPPENVDRVPVPVFFRGRLSLYFIFLGYYGFELWGSLICSLMELEHKGMPRVERFFRIIAVVSTFSLLAVVVYFSLWPCFVGFVFFQFRAKKKKNLVWVNP